MFEEISEKWWLIVLQGLIGIILGIILISYPAMSLVVLTLVLGIFALVEGALIILLSLINHKKFENWGLILLHGIITLLFGLVLFSWPGITLKILIFLTGLWFLITGIVTIIRAIQVRKDVDANEWLMVAGGLIGILVGILLISNPAFSATIAGIVIGIMLLLSGIISIAFGFQLRSTAKKLQKNN